MSQTLNTLHLFVAITIGLLSIPSSQGLNPVQVSVPGCTVHSVLTTDWYCAVVAGASGGSGAQLNNVHNNGGLGGRVTAFLVSDTRHDLTALRWRQR